MMHASTTAPEPWMFDAATGQVRDRRGNVVATLDPRLDPTLVHKVGRLFAAPPELFEAVRYTNQTIKKLSYTEDRDDAEAMLNRCRRVYLMPSIAKVDEGELP